MGVTSPEYIKETERILEKKLSTLSFGDGSVTGGIDSLVSILNSVDRGTERHLLEALEETDAELVEEIRKRMFVFEDIVKLSNQAIQRVPKEIDNRDLSALKGSSEEVARLSTEYLQPPAGDDQGRYPVYGPGAVRDGRGSAEDRQCHPAVGRCWRDYHIAWFMTSPLYKIDKTMVDNMNQNRSFIVITHKETHRKTRRRSEGGRS